MSHYCNILKQNYLCGNAFKEVHTLDKYPLKLIYQKIKPFQLFRTEGWSSHICQPLEFPYQVLVLNLSFVKLFCLIANLHIQSIYLFLKKCFPFLLNCMVNFRASISSQKLKADCKQFQDWRFHKSINKINKPEILFFSPHFLR